MLPAAGVAKLRDVTKSTFDKHVDDDNRLGGWDIINQSSKYLARQISDANLTNQGLCQHPCVSCVHDQKTSF